MGVLDEGLKYAAKTYTDNLSPSLPKWDLWRFVRLSVHWKKNNQIFGGLLDTRSEIVL